MLKRAALILSLSMLSAAIANAQEDSITMTTYYPSPYGSYREMRAKRMAVGDDYIDGATYSWDSLPLSINADADLVVEGNVGIGTTNPGANLEVAGQIKITGGSPGAGKVLTSDANGLATWEGNAVPSGTWCGYRYDSSCTGSAGYNCMGYNISAGQCPPSYTFRNTFNATHAMYCNDALYTCVKN